MLTLLREKNPSLKLYSVLDPSFQSFGKVLDMNDFIQLSKYMNTKTTMPETANVYVAHDADFALSITNKDIYKDIYGDMPIEFGYVNGFNSQLNALEYHKSSEINVALTPLVLMLGHVSDIKDKKYDSSHLIAFYVPQNTAIEIYPKVLHFSPCKVLDSGFKCAVILPYGTNMNFIRPVSSYEENLYLFKTNKWLLAHQENKRMIDLGAYIGVTGINYEIFYK